MGKIDYYNQNANEYIEKSKNADMTEFYEIISNYLCVFDKINMLDLGFGSARDMSYFKNQNIIGVDSCKAFLDNAKKNGFEVYDSLSSISNDKIFDIIYSVGLLMHLNKKDRLELFKEVKKNLISGGFFIISYNTLDRTKDKERLFFKLDKEEIDREVGLTIVEDKVIVDSRGIEWITTVYVL